MVSFWWHDSFLDACGHFTSCRRCDDILARDSQHLQPPIITPAERLHRDKTKPASNSSRVQNRLDMSSFSYGSAQYLDDTEVSISTQPSKRAPLSIGNSENQAGTPSTPAVSATAPLGNS